MLEKIVQRYGRLSQQILIMLIDLLYQLVDATVQVCWPAQNNP